MSNTDRIVRSACMLCQAGCGVLVHIKDGKPVKVIGDPSHPVNKGALCIIGRSSLEFLNSDKRLIHPLQRVGNRGEGKWKRITWDEALERIADNFNHVKEKYGAESVAFMQGNYKAYGDSYLARLANAFGSPTVASMSSICFHSNLRAMIATYGFMARPDYEYTPGCIVVWGMNPPATYFPEAVRITEALKNGSKLLVIDPAETPFAKKADIWVKPRPCSDLALALGMIHVVINENLYDREFVEKWTFGFEELKQHIQEYTPEKVAEITWVSADEIREIARFYATHKPAGIVCGNGLENNINNFQFGRASAILRAITGNIGIPGGDVGSQLLPVLPVQAFELHRHDLVPAELRARRAGAEENVLPNFYAGLPQKLIKAMLTSKPYPVRAAFVQGGNLLQSLTNSNEVYEALNSLDFLVATDFFMTPTAELADIVLPVAGYLEIDSLSPAGDHPVISIIQKVAQVGECWSDCKIISELGKHLGLSKYFWENDEAILDTILKPAGITFSEFRHIGTLSGRTCYRDYEEKGFHTSSGKVEIYSRQLEEWGFDPLPVWREPMELLPVNQGPPEEYPLVFTSMKRSSYVHSRGRQIPSLRNKNREPIVTIHSATAEKLDIKNGDWVYIENKLGKILQRAALSSKIHPQVIIADFGWWFPEKDENLHGWAESNLNVLTDNNPPYGRELGSATLRGLRCKVYKAN